MKRFKVRTADGHTWLLYYHTQDKAQGLSLIRISEPTRLLSISYAVICLKKKKTEWSRRR